MRWIALLVSVVAVAGPAGAFNEPAVELGKRETFLYDGDLGLREFPDGVISVLESQPVLKIVFSAGVSSYRLEGASLRSLHSPQLLLAPGEKMSFDNGYAGIGGLYAHADGKLYAFYHAEDQEGMGKFPNGVPGYYGRIAMAMSGDRGRTFEKIGVAVRSQQEKSAKGQPDQGCGEMCVGREPKGEYLYMYYVDHSRVDGRGVQIFLARSRIDSSPPLPRSWMKYHEGKFKEDALGGKDTPVLSAKEMNADATFPQVSYRKPLRKYVMVFNVVAYLEHPAAPARGEPRKSDVPEKSGIYIAYSDDGIAWSKPEQLVKAFSIPFARRELAWHPTILWDSEDALGGWLLYGYTPKWGYENTGGTPHYLAGRRIELRPVEREVR